MPTKTLTLQSGCPPRVMGVFEGSIVFSCERRLSHSPQFFQTFAQEVGLDAHIATGQQVRTSVTISTPEFVVYTQSGGLFCICVELE